MKKSTVIAIVVVIVGLAAVATIQKILQNRRMAAPEEHFVKILPKDMRAADIHKIDIHRGEKKEDAVVVERKGDGWIVASKFNSKGDEKNITDLLSDIKKLTGEVRTKKASLHEDFEITDEKAVHIALYDRKGKLYRDLLLGKKGDRYSEGFVRLAKSNEVYLADKNLLSNLGVYGEDDEPDAKKWLDLKIIDEDKEKLAKVELEMPGKQVVLEKKEKKKEEEEKPEEEEERPGEPEEKDEEKKEYEWVLTKPETDFKVKDSGITSLLSSISSFSGEDVADPAKTDAYGFDPASYTATITLDDDAAKTLLVGKKAEEDDKRYAKLKGEDTIYLLPNHKITGVFKKMRDLLEIEIWDLKKEEIASVHLHKPEYETLLERRLKEGKEGKEDSDYEWVLVKPETRFKLEDYRINNIISKLTKPSPDDLFLTGEPETYGLGSRSEFKAVMKMKDDSTKTVTFGKKFEDGDDRYVKFEEIAHVYSYTKYNFESVFPALTKLLNVELLKDLNRDDVVSLSYHTPDEDFVLSRKEGTGAAATKKWSVKLGEEEFDAKKSVVDDILRDATDIRGMDLVDMVMGKTEADCGLDEPSETLAISTDDDAPDKYTLLVGKKVAEDSTDRYFKIKDEAEIFILSETAFNDIFKKLEDIKVAKPPKPKEEEKEEEKDKEEEEKALLKKMTTPPVKTPPLPTEVEKAPSEEKPPAEEGKPEKPAEEKKPEEAAEKKEKPGPPTPPEEVEKEKEEPTPPEKETAPSPPPSEPEGKKEEKPDVPEDAKPAPKPPTEKPPLKKAEKEIPEPPVPKPPVPKEPIPLPPSPEGSPRK